MAKRDTVTLPPTHHSRTLFRLILKCYVIHIIRKENNIYESWMFDFEISFESNQGKSLSSEPLFMQSKRVF